MKQFLELQPTANQTFRLMGYGSRGNLVARLENSYKVEQSGDYQGACQLRYEAFQDIISTLPDDEEGAVALDRNHATTLAAMEIMLASAVDNYLAGDGEMAAAQIELLLDCDEEDPLEATPILALCYAMIGEWECLEDIDGDLGDKSAIAPLLRALRQSVVGGEIESKTIAERARFKEFVAELKTPTHDTDESYLRDISSERPSQSAEAREWWLLTEPLWSEFPEFIDALRANESE